MRKRLLYILLSMYCGVTQAQIHEIGISTGASNFIGDVGSTKYVSPKDLGYGLVYRWNRSSRHSWRASYQQINLSGKDVNSDILLRKSRGLEFKNKVQELSLGIEFNFMEFDLHHQWFAFSPYIYTGISGIRYQEKYFNAYNRSIKTGDKLDFAIPFSVGIKTQIGRNFVISAESGFRYTFTDNLDGSNPSSELYSNRRFGNIKSNDWYVFSGISITYTFGNNPCYCASEQ